MVQPEIEGMELLGPVGEGACGSIFIARVPEGGEPVLPGVEWYAVRVFNAIAINRHLIENMVRRLESGSYPSSVVPIAWKESRQGSHCMIMPMLADVDEENYTIAIRCLQDRLANYPKDDAWSVVEKLARALGEMHRRKIPHGNVKPGNIFFKQDGSIYLTDFAMGQMPGVGMLPRPGTLLYAAPEQMSNPDGYLEGKGYGWDTFAFAVIAFRLLTGKLPRCEATSRLLATPADAGQTAGSEEGAQKVETPLEFLDLEAWRLEATDPRQGKRRGIIEKCLALNPEDRYSDMNEVLRVWDEIDADARAASEKAKLRKRSTRNKVVMLAALALACACISLCVVLSGLLANQKMQQASDLEKHSTEVADLKKLYAKDEQAIAEMIQQGADHGVKASEQQARRREAKLREQLNALSVTNDHLVEWLMRSTSKELPELKAPDPASKIIADELRELLKMIDDNEEATVVRAAALLQLAELEIHHNNPSEASSLIDRAEDILADANGTADGTADDTLGDLSARLARMRLACLLQAIDNKNTTLAADLLPKARKNIGMIAGDDEHEAQRINALTQIIDGSMIEDTDPAKALAHFQRALKNLEGLNQALPEHVAMRSQLSHYMLKSAAIAQSLDLFDDAAKMRSNAANHLRAILKKNPGLELAKVDLAKIEILSAESDMRAGDDSEGAAKLKTAESLLADLPADDTSPDGVSMQMATAMGLRSIMLRDQGKRTDALKLLQKAISMTEKVVAAYPDAREPLYRLAVFHWQRAGLSGDAGNTTDKLDHGKKAAGLMEQLLAQRSKSREIELRRSLAYLYGDLGHTAQNKGMKTDAVTYFRKASDMWQSLLKVHERNIEYLDGLKWSMSRYRQLGGK